MRVVCLSCIDGRIHKAVFDGVWDLYPNAVIDLITEPGLDGFFLKDQAFQSFVLDKIDLTMQVNHANAIVCVGHYDCKGYPVSQGDHLSAIKRLVLFLKKKYSEHSCHGLWIDDSWMFKHVL